MAPPLAIEIAAAPTPVPVGACRFRFPDPRRADADGLVAAGGDLEAATLLAAYRHGLFPWPMQAVDLLWWSPDPRAIIPLQEPRVSRRLARTLRQARFRLTVNRAFDGVIAACADRGAEGTWITPSLRAAYERLHRLGWAHSLEVWSLDDALVGGLYGVAIAGLFAAESMFHRVRDASKVALVGLVQHCRAVGMRLLDVQVLSPHLASMGAVTVTRAAYLEALGRALAAPVNFATAAGVTTVE